MVYPPAAVPFASHIYIIASLLVSLALSSAVRAAPFIPTADQCPNVDQLSPDERARVRCGMFQVPEDHAAPRGRQIKLSVAIVQPLSKQAGDPLVMLHGGPGFGLTEHYRVRLSGSFGERTVILFDQRGVGLSEPALCPKLTDAIFDASSRGLSMRDETARVRAANERCQRELVARGVDLAQYNTTATVADMEALRAALGLETWDVYGVSYGTTVGLAYLAAHPERVRAMVLDSVYPVDRPPAANVVVNMMRSVHELALACSAQPACNARYGDVEALFFRALASLHDSPLQLPDVGSAFDRPVRASASAFATVIHQLLYDPAHYAALPLLIERTVARDAAVYSLLFSVFRERVKDITLGAFAAVECFERYPFDSRESYEAASVRWPLLRDNMTVMVQHYDVCAAWPARASAPMKMPDRVHVPVLVMAGGWDPMTPPADAKRAAERLGAFYFELPFHGHGTRTADCGAPLVREFLNHPCGRWPRCCERCAGQHTHSSDFVPMPHCLSRSQPSR
jgi:pimeloyl-ACP methyl ester carboxylesterase